jgi:hypothetical protein
VKPSDLLDATNMFNPSKFLMSTHGVSNAATRAALAATAVLILAYIIKGPATPFSKMKYDEEKKISPTKYQIVSFDLHVSSQIIGSKAQPKHIWRRRRNVQSIFHTSGSFDPWQQLHGGPFLSARLHKRIEMTHLLPTSNLRKKRGFFFFFSFLCHHFSNLSDRHTPHTRHNACVQIAL